MKRLAMLMLLLIATPAWADGINVPPTIADQIRANISDLPIEAIHKSPIDGLYELVVQGQIFYSDRTGRFLIASGHIFDTGSKQDLTARRLEQINRVDWSDLPLDKAIVSGDPNGKALAIFTDPDCPYCRRLENELKGMKGVKIYTFLYPLTSLHPDSRRKAEAIWCAKDRHAALTQVMIENKPIAGGGCTTPIDEIHAIAKHMGIHGTPTMIAGDGRKFSGLKSAAELKKWLNAE